MTTYKIETVTAWSARTLAAKVEKILKEKTADEWEIVSVSFGINMWWMPTGYVTFTVPGRSM